MSYSILVLLFTIISLASSTSVHENFLQCLRSRSSVPIYTPNTSSYASVLEFSIRSGVLFAPSTPKPQLIVTPLNEAHVQAAVICARKYGLHLRTRSGGHDYAGLSYTSASSNDVPFVMVDLINFASINVDAKRGTAWVQTGATLGQVYYRIAEKSNVYGFPGGFCPTVGSGGHISGGGYGPLMRMYGFAADNIVDARLVNAEGKILDRESMGEDYFWAIRGGGGGSFGIVLSWKIRLAPVPPTVTVFRINRTLEEGATSLVEKWQFVAPALPKELWIQVLIGVLNTTQRGKRTIQATFESVFLGDAEKLINIMEQQFPELGLKRDSCTEVSWIQSTLFMAGLPTDDPLDVLLDRTPVTIFYFKNKINYVREPISEIGWKGIWTMMMDDNNPQIALVPYGGRMSEIRESSIPFPYRKGNLFHMSLFTFWEGFDVEASRDNIDWIRRLYGYLTPYVSNSPRAAYVNYRDLDLGQSLNGTASYSDAKAWGIPYFNDNFERLVKVKSKVDPGNFFRNEQSIPTRGM